MILSVIFDRISYSSVGSTRVRTFLDVFDGENHGGGKSAFQTESGKAQALERLGD
jgi:hypothetical protein